MNPALRLDQLDYDVMLALREDARMKAAEIARRTGSNERTVRNRIERLVSSGLIRLTSVLDPLLAGYQMAADIFVEVDRRHEDEALQALLAMEEVNYVAYALDSNEISIQARFQDANGVRLFLKRLSVTPHVEVTRYALVPFIVKDAASWLPAREEWLPELGAIPELGVIPALGAVADPAEVVELTDTR